MQKKSLFILLGAIGIIVAAFVGWFVYQRINADEKTEPARAPISLISNFKDGQAFLNQNTCHGANVSPPIAWGFLPENTQSLVIILWDSKDSQVDNARWVRFNIPRGIFNLPEGSLEIGTLGKNSWNDQEYLGPCPGEDDADGYLLRLYALDVTLDLDEGASLRKVEKAMQGHILGQGELSSLSE
jgi:Raf kinase inhibitor-like YbhB/YbcL family protein